MASEGLHLDSRGLQLLMELASLDKQVKFLKSLGERAEPKLRLAIARRVLTRREAKSHCQQASISWERFQAALKHEGE